VSIGVKPPDLSVGSLYKSQVIKGDFETKGRSWHAKGHGSEASMFTLINPSTPEYNVQTYKITISLLYIIVKPKSSRQHKFPCHFVFLLFEVNGSQAGD